eukprot:13337114-Ditylum_brightwellii.AAC.1
MANGKAAGPSGITLDALKSSVWRDNDLPNNDPVNDDLDFLASVIHDLSTDFWESKLNFESWKQGTLVHVPKSEDLSNPTKWRPVCLLINPVIMDHGLEAQYRSLNSKGCPNANFSLRSSLQIQREHNIATHVLFMDLIKAFDL